MFYSPHKGADQTADTLVKMAISGHQSFAPSITQILVSLPFGMAFLFSHSQYSFCKGLIFQQLFMAKDVQPYLI